MAWLDRLNDRNASQMANVARRNAAGLGRLAQDRWWEFADDAGTMAKSAAQQLADYGRHDGADLVRDRARDMGDRVRRYAHAAGEAAGELAQRGRRETAVLADAAATQAGRVGRAVKADPVPVIVGALGLVLVASLLLGRRR